MPASDAAAFTGRSPLSRAAALASAGKSSLGLPGAGAVVGIHYHSSEREGARDGRGGAAARRHGLSPPGRPL